MAKRKKLTTTKFLVGTLTYLLLFAASNSKITGHDSTAKCGGTELWAQKILTDSEAKDINTTPQQTTILELINIPTDTEKRSKTNPRLAFEMQVVTVKDVLIRKVILEDDNDYHLVIQDRMGRHMVAEIVDPSCPDAQQSDFIDDYSAVRTTMDEYANKFQNYSFNITGVLFKDRFHGQTGMAKNDLEIHPILKLTKNKKLKFKKP